MNKDAQSYGIISGAQPNPQAWLLRGRALLLCMGDGRNCGNHEIRRRAYSCRSYAECFKREIVSKPRSCARIAFAHATAPIRVVPQARLRRITLRREPMPAVYARWD